LAIKFRNCIGQHLAMSGVCRRFQLAGQVAAGEKQALTLAITFALFGRVRAYILVRSDIASCCCSTAYSPSLVPLRQSYRIAPSAFD
jgi:hypothetical protein